MDFGNFVHKLRKLNPNIYVADATIESTNSELGTSGIYLRGVTREHLRGLHHLDGEARKLGDRMSGAQDLYIGWVTKRWVPEGNKYDKTGKVICFGWRGILCRFIDKGYIDRHKAERVFRTGLFSTYDKLDSKAKHRYECKYG